jgi:hypothetical protein
MMYEVMILTVWVEPVPRNAAAAVIPQTPLQAQQVLPHHAPAQKEVVSEKKNILSEKRKV